MIFFKISSFGVKFPQHLSCRCWHCLPVLPHPASFSNPEFVDKEPYQIPHDLCNPRQVPLCLTLYLEGEEGSRKALFFYSLTKCLTEIEYPPKFRRHLDWRHWVQPFHEKITAAVEPYHFEPERVPEVSKASNADIDAPERLGSLYWSIVFVVNSEKLQKSASDFLNSSNWKTGLRNLFHDFCSFLPFKYACNRALSSN